jgi:hypothetical protein
LFLRENLRFPSGHQITKLGEDLPSCHRFSDKTLRFRRSANTSIPGVGVPANLSCPEGKKSQTLRLLSGIQAGLLIISLKKPCNRIISERIADFKKGIGLCMMTGGFDSPCTLE